MKILFTLALLSFVALAGAAFAITRHIRRNAANAAHPGTDADLTQALETRLTTLVPNSNDDRSPSGESSTQQDFSYFNKEQPDKPYPAMHYPETPDAPRTPS